MAGQEAPPSHRKARTRPAGRLRRLSQRTPLRTKLITAVLGLVILALAAISIASVYMLRSYVTTQHDSQLGVVFSQLEGNPDTIRHYAAPGGAGSIQSGTVLGLQLPGHQLEWQSYTGPGGTFTL